MKDKSIDSRVARRFFSYPLRTIAGNLGFASSYFILPTSYAFYRVEKRFFNWLFRCGTPITQHEALSQNSCVIQGFRHSGNSFLISNIVEQDRVRVPTDLHRIWVVREALRSDAPVIVLIRDPLEVALSAHFRTTAYASVHTPFCLFPWAVLAGYIGYYRRIIALRDRITIIPMDAIRTNYQQCRLLILEKGGIRLRETPDSSNQNWYDGERWQVRLSLLSRLLLRWAKRQYSILTESAAGT